MPSEKEGQQTSQITEYLQEQIEKGESDWEWDYAKALKVVEHRTGIAFSPDDPLVAVMVMHEEHDRFIHARQRALIAEFAAVCDAGLTELKQLIELAQPDQQQQELIQTLIGTLGRVYSLTDEKPSFQRANTNSNATPAQPASKLQPLWWVLGAVLLTALSVGGTYLGMQMLNL